MANKVDGPSVICVKGTLTDEGTECQALRSVDGEFFTLLGDLKGFRNGDEVAVCGIIADVSFCMQGSTIVVSWIGEASSRAADDHAVRKLAAPRRQEGSPIVVGGGGSVGVHFDEAKHYKRIATNQFAHPTDEIDTVYLISPIGQTQNLLSRVHGKNCRLTISCLDSAGLDSAILIDNAPGGPLKITLREMDYPFDVAKGLRFNHDRTIGSLVTLTINTTPPQVETFAVDPRGQIVVVNSVE